MDITNIIVAIILLAGAVIMTILIPGLKVRLSSDNAEMIYGLIKIAVAAAEQIYGSKTGQKKKQYVIDYLKGKGITVNVDVIESEFNAMIEAAVYELSREQANVICIGEGVDNNERY